MGLFNGRRSPGPEIQEQTPADDFLQQEPVAAALPPLQRPVTDLAGLRMLYQPQPPAQSFALAQEVMPFRRDPTYIANQSPSSQYPERPMELVTPDQSDEQFKSAILKHGAITYATILAHAAGMPLSANSQSGPPPPRGPETLVVRSRKDIPEYLQPIEVSRRHPSSKAIAVLMTVAVIAGGGTLAYRHYKEGKVAAVASTVDQNTIIVPESGVANNGKFIAVRGQTVAKFTLGVTAPTMWDMVPGGTGFTDKPGQNNMTSQNEVDATLMLNAPYSDTPKDSALSYDNKTKIATIDLSKITFDVAVDVRNQANCTTPTAFSDAQRTKYTHATLQTLQNGGILPQKINGLPATDSMLVNFLFEGYKANQVNMCQELVATGLKAVVDGSAKTSSGTQTLQTTVEAALKKIWGLNDPNKVLGINILHPESLKQQAVAIEAKYLKDNKVSDKYVQLVGKYKDGKTAQRTITYTFTNDQGTQKG